MSESINIGQPRLNFLKLFTDMGQEWVTELKQNIRKQIGIDGSKFYPVEPSTAKARASKIGATLKMSRTGNKGIVPKTGKVRKSIAKSVPITRLFFTEKFWQKMLVFISKKDSLTVEGNSQPYGDGVTYDDIIKWNNRNSPLKNERVKPGKRPMIFPTTPKELEMTNTFNKFRVRFAQDASKQLKQQLHLSIKKNIKL